MYMSNSESIVSSFSNKELKTLVMAVRMYNMNTGYTNDTLLCKLVDSFLLSNDLESEVIKPNPNAPMGSAEYKAYEAMYESDVRAHS